MTQGTDSPQGPERGGHSGHGRPVLRRLVSTFTDESRLDGKEGVLSPCVSRGPDQWVCCRKERGAGEGSDEPSLLKGVGGGVCDLRDGHRRKVTDTGVQQCVPVCVDLESDLVQP